VPEVWRNSHGKRKESDFTDFVHTFAADHTSANSPTSLLQSRLEGLFDRLYGQKCEVKADPKIGHIRNNQQTNIQQPTSNNQHRYHKFPMQIDKIYDHSGSSHNWSKMVDRFGASSMLRQVRPDASFRSSFRPPT